MNPSILMSVLSDIDNLRMHFAFLAITFAVRVEQAEQTGVHCVIQACF